MYKEYLSRHSSYSLSQIYRVQQCLAKVTTQSDKQIKCKKSERGRCKLSRVGMRCWWQGIVRWGGGDADACRLKLELTAADFIVPTVFIPNDVAGFNLIDFSRFGFKLRL